MEPQDFAQAMLSKLANQENQKELATRDYLENYAYAKAKFEENLDMVKLVTDFAVTGFLVYSILMRNSWISLGFFIFYTCVLNKYLYDAILNYYAATLFSKKMKNEQDRIKLDKNIDTEVKDNERN